MVVHPAVCPRFDVPPHPPEQARKLWATSRAMVCIVGHDDLGMSRSALTTGKLAPPCSISVAKVCRSLCFDAVARKARTDRHGFQNAELSPCAKFRSQYRELNFRSASEHHSKCPVLRNSSRNIAFIAMSASLHDFAGTLWEQSDTKVKKAWTKNWKDG
jgi:hypothetical protein